MGIENGPQINGDGEPLSEEQEHQIDEMVQKVEDGKPLEPENIEETAKWYAQKQKEDASKLEEEKRAKEQSRLDAEKSKRSERFKRENEEGYL